MKIKTAIRNVKIPLIVVFASYWLFAIPIGYFLGFNFQLGAVGVWIGYAVGLFSVALLLTIRFNLRSRKAVSF